MQRYIPLRADKTLCLFRYALHTLFTSLILLIGHNALAQDPNLVSNGGFESGLTPWFHIGGNNSAFAVTNEQSRSGSASGKMTGRSDTWNGPAQNIAGQLIAGESYRFSAWVRLANANSDNAGITVKLTDDRGDTYIGVAGGLVNNNGWTELTGTYTHQPQGQLQDFFFYIEGPEVGVDFYVDDVTVRPTSPSLINNGGFESGTSGWFQIGDDAVLEATTERVRSGDFSGKISNRTANWNAPAQSVFSKFTLGEAYVISAFIRLANANEDTAKISVALTVNGEQEYVPVGSATVNTNSWTEISGTYRHDVNGTLEDAFFYIEGPAAGVDFYIDDVNIRPVNDDWLTQANESIEEIRKRNINFTVVDNNGNPVAGSVEIQQTRRRFGFGSAMANTVRNNNRYREFFKENFEWAVFENEIKWGLTESSRDQENFADADAMIRFAEDNNIRLRGHTVFWANEEFEPNWLPSLSSNALRNEIRERLNALFPKYRGTFEHWDVNNEMLHHDFYQRRLGNDIRVWMHQRTKALDPETVIFINDYSIISGFDTDAYVALIQQLLDDGAPIEGIGVQGHFFGPVDPVAVRSRLDRLATLGLPIWVSEYDYATPDEDARADALETLYRVAFSHPQVEGIMMWGFWAGRHWRGAEAAIVDQDWTVNAAGRRYQDLMEEWKTRVDGNLDNGGLQFRGFHGEYQATITASNGSVTEKTFTVTPGNGAQNITLEIDPGPGGGENTPPTAAFSVTSDGLQVSVDGSASSDADGDALTYRWNFGDGNTANGPTATHTYNSEGDYRITLRVSDRQSNDTTRRNVSVAPTPGGGGNNCEYSVANQWNNGFVGTITITNNGNSPINGWDVRWSYNDGSTVTNSWNTQLSGNNPYRARNISWNGTIQPGGSVEFGFVGNKGRVNQPAAIPEVTGSVCSGN